MRPSRIGMPDNACSGEVGTVFADKNMRHASTTGACPPGYALVAREEYMIAKDLETGIARLSEMVAAAKVVLPFTGAGISTECGIPDFRSPGGLWTKNRPIPFDEFLSSQEMRNEAWRRRFAMEEHFAAARPGRGHLALASLYKRGKSPGVVTQNIDNLHQNSGIATEHVIELHGNNSYALCLTC